MLTVTPHSLFPVIAAALLCVRVLLVQGIECTSSTCAASWTQCGGWRYVDGRGLTPAQKLDIRQCCDATQECVEYRNNYFQCRPKDRKPLTGWRGGTGIVQSCTPPEPKPPPSPPKTSPPALPPAGTPSGTPSGKCADTWIQGAVAANNLRRAAFGTGPVSCDEKASKVAEEWSKVMCERIKTLSHDGFFDRCKTIGWGACAENVLYNYETGASAPSDSMTQWYNSEGHRTNLMSSAYSKVGYGYWKCGDGRVYWTGMYGG